MKKGRRKRTMTCIRSLPASLAPKKMATLNSQVS